MEKRRVYIGGFKEFPRNPLPIPSVFIAQDFSGRDREDDPRDAPRQISDYRLAYEDGLRDAGYRPVYAPVHSGTILETLVKEMINTDAGIFDISFGRKYNANVLIELGISLGLNHPTIVVAEEADAPVLDFLTVLDICFYKNDDDLADRIGKVVGKHISDFDSWLSPTFCVICHRDPCACRKDLSQLDKTFLLLGAGENAGLLRHMRAVAREFDLKLLDSSSTSDHYSTLCSWLYNIKRSRFVLIYSQEFGRRHHGVENAANLVQLGLALGANVPWRFVIAENENPPTDVINYTDVRITVSAETTRSNIRGAIGVLNDEHNPYHGIYDILPPPEYVEEEALSIDATDSDVVQTPTHIFVSYSREDGREFALRVHDALEASGFAAWTDVRDTDPSQDYDRTIEIALNNSSHMLVILSPHFAQSGNVSARREILYALEHNKTVIPLQFANVTPPDLIASFTPIDFTGDWGTALATLLTSLQPSSEDNVMSSVLQTARQLEKLLLDQLERSVPSTNTDRFSIGQLWEQFRKTEVKVPQDYQGYVAQFVEIRNTVVHQARIVTSDELEQAQVGIKNVIEWLESLTKEEKRSNTRIIFISHSSKDRKFALRLSEDLRSLGYNTWVDVESIPDGSSWAREIEQAVTKCDVMITIMSKNGRESEWVERETLLALDLRKPVMVVRIDDTPLPMHLINRQFTDFRKKYEPAINRLVNALGKVSTQSKSPSTEPSRTLDSKSFFKYMEQLTHGAENARAARDLFNWAKDNADSVTFSGRSEPAFHAHVWVGAGGVVVFSVRTFSRQPAVEIPLQYLLPFPPFDKLEKRLEVLRQLNELLATPLDESRADRRPTIPLISLANESAMNKFKDILRSIIDNLRE